MVAIFTFFFLAVKAQIPDSSKANEVSADSIYTKLDVEPNFPGGESAWNRYVQQSIHNDILKNIDKLSKDKSSNGTCEVQFVIDKDGSIINVEAITMKNSLLAQLVIDIIKNGEKWQPGLKNGQPAKAYRRQKVTFRTPKE